MKFKLLFLVCIFTMISCGQEKPHQAPKPEDLPFTEIKDTTIADTIEVDVDPFKEYGIPVLDSVSYTQRKLEAENLRAKLKVAFDAKEISLDSVGRAFEAFLINHIFPHWYGTPWSYEGHTDVPKQGEVACGYFVSTTLRHSNIQINRYHLAQQASGNAAKSLGGEILTYKSINAFENNLNQGLYMVGLSNHVGYLLKRQGQLFFIHSNYLAAADVMIEKARESDALMSSDIFVLVRIGNSDLMKKWLNKAQVKVYRQ